MQKWLMILAIWIATCPAFAEELRKFREIAPGLFAGASPRNLEAVNRRGISTVVNLQGGDIDGTFIGYVCAVLQKGDRPAIIAGAKTYFESQGIRFFNFPVNSHAPKTEIEDQNIRRSLQVMAEATPLFPVYLHCHRGADRTGLLIALFRVVHQGWDPENAYQEWISSGHHFAAQFFTGELDKYYWKFVKNLPVKQESPPAPRVNHSDCSEDLFSRKI